MSPQYGYKQKSSVSRFLLNLVLPQQTPEYCVPRGHTNKRIGENNKCDSTQPCYLEDEAVANGFNSTARCVFPVTQVDCNPHDGEKHIHQDERLRRNTLHIRPGLVLQRCED
eukprot:gnl/TRDRNA2_/TRDRNA2_133256_c0_seq2.p1 gnl/TRDRNA2_/TRDRNA2_133256_c0~~gnl/TRDRNA2_/TRDRNA2_133256_c0_seq2.p1  ORF type:complete len:112 (+),score=2.31 gnl/TRDRNA2_/TRDRNA2_133256_c0_seq2:409-744(+)